MRTVQYQRTEGIMPGRIAIDDVRPVVSSGRYPAKAVVGEIVPISATVWREGHDAVAATLVVRYHGRHYPQLTAAPGEIARQTAGAAEVATRIKPTLFAMAPG